MGWIDRRKMGVVDRISNTVNFDRTILAIEPMEQAAMFHLPLRVPSNHLALKLELHDSRRFLHTRNHDLFAHPCAFDFETGSGIVGVDSPYQQVEGRHRDSVAFLQL